MLKIYNSLSRNIENFEPNNKSKVGLYSCGPTVYDYQHIGNLRTATLMDTLKRALMYLGYEIKTVMNVTDVEDKIENKAKKEGITVDEVTSKFENIYMSHLAQLNISADEYPHASKTINEQIEIIKVLVEKGYGYVNDYGVYFDISKDPDYGKLGNTFKSDKERSRIDLTEGKRNREDFALWKFPLDGEDREKLWESPWGKGFPGWHIECVAMSIKFLTNAFEHNHFHPEEFETIDIHIGGEDLKEVHHENEVAQSESATDKQFVKYWVHGGMLNIGEEKMSKSLGNFYTLKEVLDKKHKPLALRYLYYTTHYRKVLNFTWEALQSSENAFDKLVNHIQLYTQSVEEKENKSFNISEEFKNKFVEALEDDLNMPKALSVVWEVVKSDLDSKTKLSTILDFDQVLGLDLESVLTKPSDTFDEYPEEVRQLIEERNKAREIKDWAKADEIRDRLKNEFGVEVRDK